MKRYTLRGVAMIGLSLVVTLIGTGCTLSGATDAPPITIAPTVVTPQAVVVTPTRPPVIGTPTPVKAVDAFGTLTAIAPKNVTPGVGIVTPTKVGIVTPTPVVSKNVTPGAVTGGTGACPPTYTVRSGDNLFRIALKFNLTISAIAAVNKITNPDLLSVGTVLTLPCGGAASTTGGTGSTTTTTSGGTKPLAGDTVDKNGDILHTVKSGENLFRIALAYNLSWQEVAAYNGITQPNQLVIGQVIRIPTK